MNQTTNLLDIKKIQQIIDPDHLKQIKQFEIKEQINSTNDYLLQLASVDFNEVAICLAEQQTKGRGRLGRKWVSPFGANIYLSLLWPFRKNANNLAGLSLAIGTMIVDALAELQIQNIQLKWPNDILYQGKKLGGILVEVAPLRNGIVPVVIGIGLNVNMPVIEGQKIDQAWTDLNHIMGKTVDRNLVTGKLIEKMMKRLLAFEAHGFGEFIEAWKKQDFLLNHQVILKLQANETQGVARGVDASGRLLIEDQSGQITPFSFGEVTICEI